MDLELDGLTVTASGRRLIADIDAHVRSGQLVGLVGPNGSGKSSTLRCVFRTLTPNRGTVRLGGEDVAGMSLRDSARMIAALTQESQPEFDFTAAEVVTMGRAPHKSTFARHDDEDRRIRARALSEVGCEHLAERDFRTLSGGERQRVLIARALAQQPQVLVLDEPTNHLDIRHQLDVLALVHRLGLTTVTALHDLNMAASWCDRVHVLDRGRIVAAGPPREVLTPEIVREVFGVRAHVVDHPGTGAPQLLFEPSRPAA
ncbi:iron complex transport system ATP-binding protein [Saccharopolyspora lacisalsi]|uniref:Iron complex transport system ATP-binding protein n=1 Tax=Halosaccharopolyspora lacisalsi TaxID=1000566 RepID=A0A839DMD1_9PSEU|nr:ABC transporter ATP-binding protein [Halosaccharopolyspora lacisalsi]MBA8823122.1 iron complex transport system ATP-binding protein [Halosaccharopolyspora lacisalsi]